MMETMCMYFYQTTQVKYIFESLDVQTSGQYCGILAVAFTLGFTTELLSILINNYDQVTSQKVLNEKKLHQKRRLLSMALFGVRLFCAYLCMLTAMTYNGGLLIAVVLGMTSAYTTFGIQETKVYLIND